MIISKSQRKQCSKIPVYADRRGWVIYELYKKDISKVPETMYSSNDAEDDIKDCIDGNPLRHQNKIFNPVTQPKPIHKSEPKPVSKPVKPRSPKPVSKPRSPKPVSKPRSPKPVSKPRSPKPVKPRSPKPVSKPVKSVSPKPKQISSKPGRLRRLMFDMLHNDTNQSNKISSSENSLNYLKDRYEPAYKSGIKNMKPFG